MNINENGLGVTAPVSDAAESSPDSTATSQAPDITKNLKAEMNRKFSKMNEQLMKIAQAIETRSSQQSAPVEQTDDDAPVTKTYIEARLQEAERTKVQDAQRTAWTQALEMFPELNQDSDSFDEKFYAVADKHYSTFNLERDSEAPLKAVKLAALELGKIEQLTKEKLLKDESRRSRIIAEGTSAPRESKREKEVQLNATALSKLGINPEKLKQRLKANKDRYGEE
jgi:hypothetical protein